MQGSSTHLRPLSQRGLDPYIIGKTVLLNPRNLSKKIVENTQTQYESGLTSLNLI